MASNVSDVVVRKASGQERPLSEWGGTVLLIGLGAVPGALLRWQVGCIWGDQNLLVNAFGAALLGMLSGLSAALRRQLLLGIGFCGSVTTYS